MTDVPTAGAVEKITDSVARVALPLPLPDLRVVNCYLHHAPTGVTLIDPGWAYPPAEQTLVEALADLEFSVSDVRRIVVTHQHWDHYSLGVRWRDQHHIELLLGADERYSIEAFERRPDAVHPNQIPKLVEAGAADLAIEVEKLEWEVFEKGVAFSPPDRWLHDGELIEGTAGDLIVHATPGHTRGHIVFEDTVQGLIFTGDHLLPRITPSIAFERAPERLPLRSYLSSLQLILALPDARMLPAHGSADRTTRARAIELIDHHEHRLQEVGDLVAKGSTTSMEVAEKMLWTRKERKLDELSTVHRMTAVLEVQAHLDLLTAQGRLTDIESAGVRYFAPA
ncbi:MBL fold metallo-hydrolase [Mycobacterium sp. GA-2829]|uniref:MBL fold metallo-hydrolase n=1 Tax=Mycobacterium sp. GA-2829 TaxID=1772283 RepID=UPI0007403A56|nr:MBL fold metallo-hydrolase [Mycobacterium sp. GA-2829]KUI34230.1 MBL fold metallo-hydrolase [Mycobacterium sp. GA-2829]